MDVDDIFQSVFTCDSNPSLTSASTPAPAFESNPPVSCAAAVPAASSSVAVLGSATAAIPSSVAMAAAAGPPANSSNSHHSQFGLVQPTHHLAHPDTSVMPNSLPQDTDFGHDTVAATSPFLLTTSSQSNPAHPLLSTYHSPETSTPSLHPTSPPSNLPVSGSFPAPGATFSPTFHSIITMLYGNGRLEHDDDSRNIIEQYSNCREQLLHGGNNTAPASGLNDSVGYEHPLSTFTNSVPSAQCLPPSKELQSNPPSYHKPQSPIQKHTRPLALPQHHPQQHSFGLHSSPIHDVIYEAPPQSPVQTQLQSYSPWQSQSTTHNPSLQSQSQSAMASCPQYDFNSRSINQVPNKPVTARTTTVLGSEGAAPLQVPQTNSVSAAPRPCSASLITAANTPSTTNSSAPSPPCTPHSTSHYKRGGGPPSAATFATNDISVPAAATAAATTTPTSCPAKAPAAASAAAGVSTTGKIGKARDKLAKLHKRLKCFSQEQLVEQVLHFVRADVLSERTVYDTMSHLKIDHLIQRCYALRRSVLIDISRHMRNLPSNETGSSGPRGASADGDVLDGIVGSNSTIGDEKDDIELKDIPNSVLDATCFKHCRKSLQKYRSGVCSLGKMLVDGTLWTDLLRFCIGALSINNGLPIWIEEAHNKPTRFVTKKLHWFAEKAASALLKMKSSTLSATGTRSANGGASTFADSPIQYEFDALVAKCDIFPQAYSLLREMSSSDRSQGNRFRPDAPNGYASIREEDADADVDIDANLDAEADADIDADGSGLVDGNLKINIGRVHLRNGRASENYSSEAKEAVSGADSGRTSPVTNLETGTNIRRIFAPGMMGVGEDGSGRVGTDSFVDQVGMGEVYNGTFGIPMSSPHLDIEM